MKVINIQVIIEDEADFMSARNALVTVNGVESKGETPEGYRSTGLFWNLFATEDYEITLYLGEF